MLKTTTFTIAIAAMSALFALDASALPLAAAKQQAAVESQLTLVRDGCGRGMRFSNHRDDCVVDRHSRSRRDFRSRHHFVSDECRRGWRFSNSRQRCVQKNPVSILLNALSGNKHHNRHHPRYQD